MNQSTLIIAFPLSVHFKRGFLLFRIYFGKEVGSHHSVKISLSHPLMRRKRKKSSQFSGGYLNQPHA